MTDQTRHDIDSVITKNHEMRYQAKHFNAAFKHSKLLNTLNLRLLVTNLQNIVNERDKKGLE
jgi:hypothetical protein|tara:strand:- start:724 stop:909 length:186 start_codon:yes stop_codon:yes gene_type:complete